MPTDVAKRTNNYINYYINYVFHTTYLEKVSE
jgi:hypothetical protein